MTTSFTTWHAPFLVPSHQARYNMAIANDAAPVIQAHMEANKHNICLADYASNKAATHSVIKFIQNTVNEIWYKDLKNLCTFYNSVTTATSTKTVVASTLSTSSSSLPR